MPNETERLKIVLVSSTETSRVSFEVFGKIEILTSTWCWMSSGHHSMFVHCKLSG